MKKEILQELLKDQSSILMAHVYFLLDVLQISNDHASRVSVSLLYQKV